MSLVKIYDPTKEGGEGGYSQVQLEVDIKPGSNSISGDMIAKESITGESIKKGSIGELQLADKSISINKLSDLALQNIFEHIGSLNGENGINKVEVDETEPIKETDTVVEALAKIKLALARVPDGDLIGQNIKDSISEHNNYTGAHAELFADAHDATLLKNKIPESAMPDQFEPSHIRGSIPSEKIPTIAFDKLDTRARYGDVVDVVNGTTIDGQNGNRTYYSKNSVRTVIVPDSTNSEIPVGFTFSVIAPSQYYIDIEFGVKTQVALLGDNEYNEKSDIKTFFRVPQRSMATIQKLADNYWVIAGNAKYITTR